MDARPFDLIPPHRVQSLRRGGINDQGNEFEPGIATGRARCRSCGEKILKGAPELVGYWDFRGCGSWTSVPAHLHAEACPPPSDVEVA